MTRTFFFLFLFLFLAACGKDSSSGNSKSGMGTTISEADLASPVAPVEAQTFDISAQISGFERAQEEKLFRAFEVIKKVIASDDFKKMILNKMWKGKKQFVDNNGLTNAQIYKKILEGSEMLNQRKNNTMDLRLQTYHENANVIGYTMPTTATIYMNTKYLNRGDFTTSEVAMNLTHEWLHKLGFKHAVKRTPSRADSVPYAIGYIMRALAARME